MVRIAPSVLGADFSRLAEEIIDADKAGVDLLHLDIMDGHFVPNISFGPGIVKTINNLTDTYLDVHLMLSEPEKYFEPFQKAGADAITFHIEVHPDPVKYLNELRTMKLDVGLSLNPNTKVDMVLPYLKYCDQLLVMSVFPGFGGQGFIESALDTVTVARKFIDENKLSTLISIDGGVDSNNAQRIVDAGADILVMGTAFFKSKDRTGLVKKIKNFNKQRIIK
ncbi:MAG: ribulose-phosphate 3-epimerase [Candidatus Zixiibacteriota bacterium]